MFRSASRAALRNTQSSLAPARTGLSSSRRYIGTAPPHLHSRSWRSSAVRWGIAIAGIYYYNTSPVFAEYPENNLLNPNVDAIDAAEGTTIDQLTASSKNKKAAQKSQLQNVVENASRDLASQTSPDAPENSQNTVISDGAQELEQEAEGEGAFNPLTGEINWDCPCLGGMAYGPCGPQFREAFSCFVYSQEEPKGMECIDKFQAMQDCFRAHPEVYKGELEDDEEHMNDVEGFEAEKQELKDEIAQRKAQLAERQKVDEENSNKKEVKARKAKKSAPPAATPATAAEPHPESLSNTAGPHMSAKTEANQAEPGQPAKTTVERSEYKQADENESPAPSRMISIPGNAGVSKDAVSESESAVPKASHDAR